MSGGVIPARGWTETDAGSFLWTFHAPFRCVGVEGCEGAPLWGGSHQERPRGATVPGVHWDMVHLFYGACTFHYGLPSIRRSQLFGQGDGVIRVSALRCDYIAGPLQ